LPQLTNIVSSILHVRSSCGKCCLPNMGEGELS
jgi:hypothetical protein